MNAMFDDNTFKVLSGIKIPKKSGKSKGIFDFLSEETPKVKEEPINKVNPVLKEEDLIKVEMTKVLNDLEGFQLSLRKTIFNRMISQLTEIELLFFNDKTAGNKKAVDLFNKIAALISLVSSNDILSNNSFISETISILNPILSKVDNKKIQKSVADLVQVLTIVNDNDTAPLSDTLIVSGESILKTYYQKAVTYDTVVSSLTAKCEALEKDLEDTSPVVKKKSKSEDCDEGYSGWAVGGTVALAGAVCYGIFNFFTEDV